VNLKSRGRLLQLKSPSQLCHFLLSESLALLGGLLYGRQDNFLKELDVVRVDDLLVDLDGDDITGPVQPESWPFAPASSGPASSIYLNS